MVWHHFTLFDKHEVIHDITRDHIHKLRPSDAVYPVHEFAPSASREVEVRITGIGRVGHEGDLDRVADHIVLVDVTPRVGVVSEGEVKGTQQTATVRNHILHLRVVVLQERVLRLNSVPHHIHVAEG